MKNILFVISVSVILMNSLVSCRSSKNITKAIERKDSTVAVIVAAGNTVNADSIEGVNKLLASFKTNKIKYETFSAKVRLEYEDGENKVPDLNAFIRIKRDSAIWINLEKLAFNAARILITKDSFFFMHKIDNYAIVRPISFIKEMSGIPFDLSTLEDLLVGNPIFIENTLNSYKQNEATITASMIGKVFKNFLTLEKGTFAVKHSKLDDVDVFQNRTCDISYDEYELENGINFSKQRTVIISEKTKLQIDLKFKNYKLNEVLSFPFSIPKSYKRK